VSRGTDGKFHSYDTTFNVLLIGSGPTLLVNCDHLILLYCRGIEQEGWLFQCHLIQHCCEEPFLPFYLKCGSIQNSALLTIFQEQL
jgi:hypothetical protein